MAPKKKEQTKLSLNDFMNDATLGTTGSGFSWADEVEETSHRSSTNDMPRYSSTNDRDYARSRDFAPITELPTRPPYTAHVSGIDYNLTSAEVTKFFEETGLDIVSVRLLEKDGYSKGAAFVDFASVDGLDQALKLAADGKWKIVNPDRPIRVQIAAPRADRGDGDSRGEMARGLSSWERKGPLADMPGRSNDRRPADFGERRGPRDAPADDGKVRDFGNWERKGPLSPALQPERSEGSRDSSRPRTNDGNRADSFRKDRRASPATWGEGRQEGSRPPREFRERPERTERPERAPTAADMDNKWRSNMRPDPPAKSPAQSREGSEAPSSPAGVGPAAAPAPAGRPRLNLQKRTVSEAPDVLSPGLSSAGGDSKGNPFGAARPIDTAAKEREIEDKRVQVLKEKKEAEEKAKEERRLAKENAAKEAAEKATADAEKAAADAEKAAADAEKAKSEKTESKEEVAAETKGERKGMGAQNGGNMDQRVPSRPRENPKPRASDTGNWRSSGEQRGRGGGYVNAPRGRGDARGRGSAPRGPRGHESRPSRANGGSPASAAQQPASPTSPASDVESTPVQGADGWTTVATKKGRPGARA